MCGSIQSTLYSIYPCWKILHFAFSSNFPICTYIELFTYTDMCVCRIVCMAHAPVHTHTCMATIFTEFSSFFPQFICDVCPFSAQFFRKFSHLPHSGAQICEMNISNLREKWNFHVMADIFQFSLRLIFPLASLLCSHADDVQKTFFFVHRNFSLSPRTQI